MVEEDVLVDTLLDPRRPPPPPPVVLLLLLLMLLKPPPPEKKSSVFIMKPFPPKAFPVENVLVVSRFELSWARRRQKVV